ncbi:hypothetical protein [Bifidobacterium longum]|uniref:hypothetical protein n=1 Tax=Bifidobacterium longum TaxID=216816 RepID=UPI003D014FBC
MSPRAKRCRFGARETQIELNGHFLLGVSNVPVPWDTLILSVVLFVVIPLAGGMLTRSAVIKRKGQCTLRRLSSVCLTVQLPLAYC